MAYEIFARKYRPRTFDDVVGQQAVAQTLRNAVMSKRVAPVYIFAGSHGVGKTSMARIMAKALNCAEAEGREGNPCGTCEVCTSVATGDALDVVEIDAASNRGIDDARQLREGVYYRPAAFKWKVYILDEFHQLSKEAFDALLKTFEEAPEHVCFILATTELHKVPSTIRSRSQTFEFKRASLNDVTQRLKQIAEAEKIEITDGALELIARRSRGSLRDSQKLFDQVVALSGSQAIVEDNLASLMGFASATRVHDTIGGIIDGDAAKILSTVHTLYESGQNPEVFVADLVEAFRGLLYLKIAPNQKELFDDLVVDIKEISDVAKKLERDAIMFAMQLLNETADKMRRARDERVHLELTLIRLTQIGQLQSMGEVVGRLQRLEQALTRGRPLTLTGGGSPPGELGDRGRVTGSGTSSVSERFQKRLSARNEQQASDSEPGSMSRTADRGHSQRGSEREAPAAHAKPEASSEKVRGVSLEVVRAQWQQIVNSVKKRMLQRAMEKCTPAKVVNDDGQLNVTLDCAVAPFMRRNLETSHDEIVAMAERQFGVPVHFVMRFVDANKALSATGPRSDNELPIVKYAREKLGARLNRREH